MDAAEEINITYIAGQSGDSEDEMKLSERFLIFDSFRARDIFVIKCKEHRSMNNWEERSPFLEEYVDELIGDHTWRSFPFNAMRLDMTSGEL